MDQEQDHRGLLVHNPNGGLLNVNVSMTDRQRRTNIVGQMTARSEIEIPLPELVRTGKWSFRATARDSRGKLLDEKIWESHSDGRASRRAGSSARRSRSEIGSRRAEDSRALPPLTADTLHAWPTLPYA